MKGSIGKVEGSVQALESKTEASIGKLDMNLGTVKTDLDHYKTNGHSETMKDESPKPKADSLETDTGDKQGEPVA